MTQKRNILNNVGFVNIQIVFNMKAASVSTEFQTFDVRRNKLLAQTSLHHSGKETAIPSRKP